ncbi:MAG: homoserine O-acetyltransferase MetX [Pseudoclavibacter sp.]
MDWTDHGISPPSGRIPNDELRAVSLRPPASGAWRDGDDVGHRQFAWLGAFSPEHGGELPLIRLAYETWGTLNADKSNAILVLHALTGDSHVEGLLGPGHPTAGWWPGIIGPGAPLDTDQYFVVAPNMLGGCQGSTGPASLDSRGNAYGASFPVLTIRDQVRAQSLLADELGISTFAAVIGGSMGGMHALEWGIMLPDRTKRLIVMSAPAASDAQTIAQNTLQIEAIRLDPNFNGGDYADEPAGFGPHRGLALARRLAMLNYRSGTELDDRFGRSWQSNLSPEQDEGRYAVESYLDFHGNRFTRRFDANSYITLLTAMSSHNVGRDRGGVDAALARVTASTMVIGISTDVLFPPETQHRIAAGVPNSYSGDRAVTIRSNFGHDGFLLEIHHVGDAIRSMLANG